MPTTTMKNCPCCGASNDLTVGCCRELITGTNTGGGTGGGFTTPGNPSFLFHVKGLNGGGHTCVIDEFIFITKNVHNLWSGSVALPAWGTTGHVRAYPADTYNYVKPLPNGGATALHYCTMIDFWVDNNCMGPFIGLPAFAGGICGFTWGLRFFLPTIASTCTNCLTYVNPSPGTGTDSQITLFLQN